MQISLPRQMGLNVAIEVLKAMKEADPQKLCATVGPHWASFNLASLHRPSSDVDTLSTLLVSKVRAAFQDRCFLTLPF